MKILERIQEIESDIRFYENLEGISDERRAEILKMFNDRLNHALDLLESYPEPDENPGLEEAMARMITESQVVIKEREAVGDFLPFDANSIDALRYYWTAMNPERFK